MEHLFKGSHVAYFGLASSYRTRHRIILALASTLVCIYTFVVVGLTRTPTVLTLGKSFTYPMEIDMPALVAGVMLNETTNYKPINNVDVGTLLENKALCESADGRLKHTFLLLVIKSKIDNFERREAIRGTWANDTGIPMGLMQHVFVVGSDPTDVATTRKLAAEHAKHRDLVQASFKDHYYNNTLKVLVSMHWATSRCPKARFLGFVDDDFFVAPANVFRLLHEVPSGYDTGNYIIGNIIRAALPKRSPESKWYISKEEYALNVYPPYSLGGCFFMPVITAKQMFIVSQYTEYLRSDDVFLGIVAYKLGVSLLHSDDIYPERPKFPGIAQEYERVVGVHNYEASEITSLWAEYNKLVRDKFWRRAIEG